MRHLREVLVRTLKLPCSRQLNLRLPSVQSAGRTCIMQHLRRLRSELHGDLPQLPSSVGMPQAR